jgi:two-component system sensor histidine kinase KdpD
MQRSLVSYAIALFGVAGIAWLTVSFLPAIGITSAALLFLLPVLYASARGGLLPGLLAAFAGAIAYNFFLLPPRFTLRIHGFDNFVSVIVFVAVAVVTSRLATLLKAREEEALGRAAASDELAALSSLLATVDTGSALDEAIGWLEERYGRTLLIREETLPAENLNLSSLDLAAVAWALHNGDMTGHGTEIMPAADWTCVPLGPRGRGDPSVMAIASPVSGTTRSEGDLEHLRQVAALLGQASDRDELEKQRRERERLAQGEKLRRTFLASLAHDFHTPLTVITGRLAALSRDVPDAGEALDAARRLERMLEDLLGAARIEDGSVVPRNESVDLVDVVGAALDAVHLPKRITLHRDIPSDLPFVRADPVLLRHVLVNLLDNAGRHAITTIDLNAQCKGQQVVLSVCNDGQGIPQADRMRIFDRFTRLEGDDRGLGSGLGLSIVKGFAEAMGVVVEVADAASGGVCFNLSLPAAGPLSMEGEP